MLSGSRKREEREDGWREEGGGEEDRQKESRMGSREDEDKDGHGT